MDCFKCNGDERERAYYYATRSVEILTKHIFCDNEINEFHVLKEETLDGIIRISEKEYPNGLLLGLEIKKGWEFAIC